MQKDLQQYPFVEYPGKGFNNGDLISLKIHLYEKNKPKEWQKNPSSLLQMGNVCGNTCRARDSHDWKKGEGRRVKGAACATPGVP